MAESVYDEAANTLTVILKNTVLSSGARTEFTDETDRNYYTEYQELYGFPTDFPAGTLDDSNLFISQTEVLPDGPNTKIILTLTAAAQQYTSESGQLLRNESRPWLSLTFREERGY